MIEEVLVSSYIGITRDAIRAKDPTAGYWNVFHISDEQRKQIIQILAREETMPEDNKGFYQKYTVIDNRTGEEVEEATFTFNLETDPDAEVAMLAYAEAIRDKNPALYRDILDMFG